MKRRWKMLTKIVDEDKVDDNYCLTKEKEKDREKKWLEWGYSLFLVPKNFRDKICLNQRGIINLVHPPNRYFTEVWLVWDKREKEIMME